MTDTPTLHSLITRHRASADLHLTATVRGSFSPRPNHEEPVVLDIWFAPADRWRVQRADRTVYVRDGDDAFGWKNNQMHRLDPSTRQWAALQPVNPLWFFGSQSLLAHWADTAGTSDTSSAHVSGAITIDGRTGWQIEGTRLSLGQCDPLGVVVDSETGVILQIASAGGRLTGVVTDLTVTRAFPAGTFAWTGDVAPLPNDDRATSESSAIDTTPRWDA